MNRYRSVIGMTTLVALALLVGYGRSQPGKDGADGVHIDKAKGTVSIDARIAPRKLPIKELEGKVMPIEVIATWPYPKGQKAHETVVTIEAKPSAVHKALVELGLKPGKVVMGEGEPQGPPLKVYIEVPDATGGRRIPIDKALIDARTGKPFPRNVQWRFTGSALVKPDPAKDEKVYGADKSGTLIVIFPVTNQTVLQTNLTMKYAGYMKLETNTKVLPKEGTPVKLVLQAIKGK